MAFGVYLFFIVPYPCSIDLVHSRTASLSLEYPQQRQKHQIRHLQCVKYNDVIVHLVIVLSGHDSSIENISKAALKYIIVMISFFSKECIENPDKKQVNFMINALLSLFNNKKQRYR